MEEDEIPDDVVDDDEHGEHEEEDDEEHSDLYEAQYLDDRDDLLILRLVVDDLLLEFVIIDDDGLVLHDHVVDGIVLAQSDVIHLDDSGERILSFGFHKANELGVADLDGRESFFRRYVRHRQLSSERSQFGSQLHDLGICIRIPLLERDRDRQLVVDDSDDEIRGVVDQEEDVDEEDDQRKHEDRGKGEERVPAYVVEGVFEYSHR